MRLMRSALERYNGSMNLSSAETASVNSFWDSMRGVRIRTLSIAFANTSSDGIL